MLAHLSAFHTSSYSHEGLGPLYLTIYACNQSYESHGAFGGCIFAGHAVLTDPLFFGFPAYQLTKWALTTPVQVSVKGQSHLLSLPTVSTTNCR